MRERERNAPRGEARAAARRSTGQGGRRGRSHGARREGAFREGTSRRAHRDLVKNNIHEFVTNGHALFSGENEYMSYSNTCTFRGGTFSRMDSGDAFSVMKIHVQPMRMRFRENENASFRDVLEILSKVCPKTEC